jgi:FtsH-binding integral membrane protein
MTFRRFLIWLGERLIEWQLAIALLLAVKFLLPIAPESYIDFNGFAAGMRETLSNNLADAAFMTQNFMSGDWGLYWWKSWQAAGWIIGLYIYLQGLYLFTSLLAQRIAPHNPVRGTVLAFLISFAVLCALHADNHDLSSLRLALILLVGGLVIVTLSAAFGKLFTNTTQPVARRRAPLPRSPVFDEGLPDELAAVAVASQPSVLRRERLYFSD